MTSKHAFLNVLEVTMDFQRTLIFLLMFFGLIIINNNGHGKVKLRKMEKEGLDLNFVNNTSKTKLIGANFGVTNP